MAGFVGVIVARVDKDNQSLLITGVAEKLRYFVAARQLETPLLKAFRQRIWRVR